jgi:hypothetical protein
MYKIGIKHNGAIIATTDLLVEEAPDNSFEFQPSGKGVVFEVRRLVFIVDLFEKKFGLDISQYRLNEYESLVGYFFIHIRNEDLQKLREEKLTKLGL